MKKTVVGRILDEKALTPLVPLVPTAIAFMEIPVAEADEQLLALLEAHLADGAPLDGIVSIVATPTPTGVHWQITRTKPGKVRP